MVQGKSKTDTYREKQKMRITTTTFQISNQSLSATLYLIQKMDILDQIEVSK